MNEEKGLGFVKQNKDLMREYNRMLVLNLIRKAEVISRTEIAKRTTLGISTVTYIIEELLSQNWVYQKGVQSSTGGRPAINVVFNNQKGITAAVKIEEERIIVVLTDLSANIVASIKEYFEIHTSPEIVIDIVAKAIKKLLTENNFPDETLFGIGLISSGIVNRQQGIILKSTLLNWTNVNIANSLSKIFHGIPVYVDKNINALTLAELEFGEGRYVDNFACISVGAGLGLSLVINREIYYGAIGGAGEYGHTTIQVHGYECHCGQHGCLEMYASEFYFKNRGKELLKDYPDTKISEFSFDEVAKCANLEDELATRLIKEMSDYLAYGIRSAINTLNPEKILLVGEGMEYYDLLLPALKERCGKNFFTTVDYPTEILKSELDNNAWLTGAALLVINNLFQMDSLESRGKE